MKRTYLTLKLKALFLAKDCKTPAISDHHYDLVTVKNFPINIFKVSEVLNLTFNQAQCRAYTAWVL